MFGQGSENRTFDIQPETVYLIHYDLLPEGGKNDVAYDTFQIESHYARIVLRGIRVKTA